MYNIDDQVQILNSLKDDLEKQQKLPNDTLLNEYETILEIKFSDEYRDFIKNIEHVLYNGLDNSSMDGIVIDVRNLLECTKEARTIELPRNWLPIVEDNGDYYCVRPDGKVAFWSHNGSTDETWDNIATWIQDVWIGGN
ncbi:unnamed protein product [Commensalibacter communis]|uniref:SUKH superfamily protein n=1 Tax=Commensalibacter communis TaxID=2972786 RepID=A0A9W4TNJ0_9PROT|nr:SMI1/KNR4 family protein [Commensalibacter communis]CAI3939292.1 unnamed protein product [Commensalibacter communis]CAI3941055.1 unnamed protein product [Commensalibacter communis]CAI3944213.1 unnamed protein product [Commensalibacter communis]CAI3945593.1 unnamed protein product [Commensalibacter communis]